MTVTGVGSWIDKGTWMSIVNPTNFRPVKTEVWFWLQL